MRRRRLTSKLKVTAFSLWVALVSLYFLWETAAYRGLTAMLAEWQFDNFGRYYPTLTFAIIVFLLSLPGYLLFLRPRRAGTRQFPALAIRSGHVFSRALAGVAIGLAATAVGAFLAMLWLPGAQAELQRYTVQREGAILPHEGPTELSGTIAYDRIAAFDQNLIVARRNTRFAPVGPVAGPVGRVQFFIELPPIDQPTGARIATMSGVLRQGGLPGELVRLYRYAGYDIDQPYFVLFIDPAAMRWPYISAAVQLAIAAVLAGIVALIQSRRLRRIERTARSPDGAQAANHIA